MNFDISPAWIKLQEMAQGFLLLLPNLVLALLLFMFFIVAARWIRKLVLRVLDRRGGYRNVGLVIGRLASALVILLGLLVSLSILLPSFRAVDLIQVLGLSSVAIGFAFRDVLQNFLAGILILLSQPFRIGDEIQVNNYTGVVQEIQTRATLIRTGDGFLVVIPNSIIYTQTVTVFNANPTRRTSADFVIGYGDDPDLAREVMLETLGGIEGVLEEPAPSVVVKKLVDNGVLMTASWWTQSSRANHGAVSDRAIPAIKRRLNEQGIDLPYPTQQILFHDQTEETDGDRTRQREGWPAVNGHTPRPRSIAGSIRETAEAISSSRVAAQQRLGEQPRSDAAGRRQMEQR